MIYSVTFFITDKEKFEAAKPVVPETIVSEDFDSAYKTASKFESDCLTLCELKVVSNGHSAIARGYKGV